MLGCQLLRGSRSATVRGLLKNNHSRSWGDPCATCRQPLRRNNRPRVFQRAHRLDLSDFETVDLFFCKVGDLQYRCRRWPTLLSRRADRLTALTLATMVMVSWGWHAPSLDSLDSVTTAAPPRSTAVCVVRGSCRTLSWSQLMRSEGLLGQQPL